jgi:hypothetical protein
MKLTHLPSISLGLLLCLCVLQCTSVKRAAETRPASAPKLPDRYSEAVAAALQSGEKDELTTRFRVNVKVPVSGGHLKGISRLRVLPGGELLVLDAVGKQAGVYDRSGKYLNPVGGRGNKPGYYSTPSDVAVGGDGTIAVSDFQLHRVNIYTPDGKFQRSFIYTPQGFSAQRIVYSGKARSFFISGNRWQNDADGITLGALLIHKYTESGDFESSFLPFPEKFKALDLYASDTLAMDVDGDYLYAAFPFDYKVYRLASGGEPSTLIAQAPPSFAEPTSGLNLSGTDEDAESNARNWQLTWTPITSLIADGDTLLLQYQTFDPLRYTLDGWSLRSKKKLFSLKTSRKLMAKRGGDFYFLDNLETKDQPQYVLRARLVAS